MIEIERFKASSDDGTYETTIVVMRRVIDASSHDHPIAHIGGLKLMRTIERYECTPADGDAIKVFHPGHPHGVIVRRVE